jgi:hypothetical protein
LVYEGLDICGPGGQTESIYDRMQALDEEQKQQRKQADTNRRKMREVPKSHSNGYKYIKEKLIKSNTRITSVKVHMVNFQFGVPFTQVCDIDVREKTFDKVEVPVTVDKSGKCIYLITVIDWNDLQIDQDREVFFKGLLNRYEVSLQSGIYFLIQLNYLMQFSLNHLNQCL